MTYKLTTYGKLLAETLPAVIESDAEYERMEGIFDRFLSKGEDHLSPEESRLLALLASLLESYESKRLSALPDSSPLVRLKFLMAENNLRQKDVVDLFGSQSVASEVLSGKRKISRRHAVSLAQRFSVSADLFL